MLLVLIEKNQKKDIYSKRILYFLDYVSKTIDQSIYYLDPSTIKGKDLKKFIENHKNDIQNICYVNPTSDYLKVVKSIQKHINVRILQFAKSQDHFINEINSLGLYHFNHVFCCMHIMKKEKPLTDKKTYRCKNTYEVINCLRHNILPLIENSYNPPVISLATFYGKHKYLYKSVITKKEKKYIKENYKDLIKECKQSLFWKDRCQREFYNCYVKHFFRMDEDILNDLKTVGGVY